MFSYCLPMFSYVGGCCRDSRFFRFELVERIVRCNIISKDVNDLRAQSAETCSKLYKCERIYCNEHVARETDGNFERPHAELRQQQMVTHI